MQARFGQIDAQGNYAQQGEPIGRDNLEQAVRAAVDAIGERNGSALASRLADSAVSSAGLSQIDAGRAREIAEVEPLASCRTTGGTGLAGHSGSFGSAGAASGIGATGDATRATCRLLIERNDPILTAIRRPASMLLEGDFSFERDGAGQGWHTAPEFVAQFSQAVLQGRAALLRDAAHVK